FGRQFRRHLGKPREVAAWVRDARNDAGLIHVIVTGAYDDGYCARCLPCCVEHRPAYGQQDHIDLEGHQFAGDVWKTFRVSLSGSELECNVPTLFVAQVAQARYEMLVAISPHARDTNRSPDHAHARDFPALLSVDCCRRADETVREQRYSSEGFRSHGWLPAATPPHSRHHYKRAPFHSITLSARARMLSGMITPSALAVLRLI